MENFEEETINFVSNLFGDYQLTGKTFDKRNINVICPICKKNKGNEYSNKKLAIKISNHKIQCWVCGYKSKNLLHLVRYKAKECGLEPLKEYQDKFCSLLNLNKDFINNNKQIYNTFGLFEDFFEDIEEVHLDTPELPENFILLADIWKNKTNNFYIQKHLNYLKARNLLNEEDLWYWKFCIAPQDDKEFANRIIIPSFGQDGVLNFFSGRSVYETYFKYINCLIPKSSIIFNEHVIEWDKPLILVEGPFDLCKTRLLSSNVTPLLGKTMDETHKLFKTIISYKTPIIIAIDPKEIKQKRKLATLVQSYGNTVSVLDYPDNIEDIGSLSQEEVITLFKKYTNKFDPISELKKQIMRI